MRRWYIVYRLPTLLFARKVVEAATAAGAIAKFFEMTTGIDGGAVESVFLATHSDMEGMGLPTGPDPTAEKPRGT